MISLTIKGGLKNESAENDIFSVALQNAVASDKKLELTPDFVSVYYTPSLSGKNNTMIIEIAIVSDKTENLKRGEFRQSLGSRVMAEAKKFYSQMVIAVGFCSFKVCDEGIYDPHDES